eukprot:CAMPEP_0204536216 /NCGR_PEP_ID=MMETSP0661-20131031/14295_1 /ASSEMBLY_ACC=CAM_ASM_000606 /TAXON_ID=109239 /ORGANISM="Alexandrium margalefi, Strain AMGDE01CS-322" /LENGTH=402 /DNA_ID=CAMNT_0051542733 /DNA_START=65 /DNA_END=1273 /DNA_ORIENTATION=+
MAPLAVRAAAGLLLAAGCRPGAAAHGALDATALIQMGQARAQARDNEETEEQLWEVPGGLPDEPGYAFTRFQNGELIEGKSKSGKWLPCIVTGRGQMNLWNIHVSDEFPGFDLPNVPASLLRRTLKPGQTDWLVDNSWLHHSGKGIKYRYTKSVGNKSIDYAPWGSLLTGTDEQDGWLRTESGFVPFEVNGVPVLVRKDREESESVALPAEFARAAERAQQAMQPKDPTPMPLNFVVGERVEFRTKRGDWFPAQVSANAGRHDIYHVVVRADEYTMYPVSNVHASRLRKISEPAVHVPQAGESPMCQKEGCLLIRVRASTGKEMFMHMSKRMRLEMLMKMACNRLKIEEGCTEQSKFRFHGKSIDPTMHLEESGLADQDVVDMNVVIISTTRDPIDRLLEGA